MPLDWLGKQRADLFKLRHGEQSIRLLLVMTWLETNLILSEDESIDFH